MTPRNPIRSRIPFHWTDFLAKLEESGIDTAVDYGEAASANGTGFGGAEASDGGDGYAEHGSTSKSEAHFASVLNNQFKVALAAVDKDNSSDIDRDEMILFYLRCVSFFLPGIAKYMCAACSLIRQTTDFDL